ncbi:hypothetical protein CP556_22235 [Natrinema sp. CBA1119]|nr:hypothetical protein CP556_22235 [Natrinema sp. CBA1119]
MRGSKKDSLFCQYESMMTETYEAIVDEIQSQNDRKVVLVTVKGPDHLPKRFMEITTNRRVKHLKNLTESQGDVPGHKIGRVPAQYDEG